MGYEFSTCFRGSDLVFKKIVEKFGHDQICASRHAFTLNVQLKVSSKFELAEIYHTGDLELGDADYANLATADIDTITVAAKDISDSGESVVAMLSIADLLNSSLAGAHPYKSVILPSIVNYGVDASMSHQCALMAFGAPYRSFLFYEPYGLYEKFGKSYKHCFRKLLEVFTRLDSFKHYHIGMYHDYFRLGPGIQSMMIDQARENRAKFSVEYNRIKGLMGEADIPWKYENDDYDKTFEGSTLMSMASDKPEFIEDAAVLYRNNSAKICVSIFLVESARIMYALSQINEFGPDHVHQYISEWYQNFSKRATARLLKELFVLIGSLYPKTRYEIFEAFRNPNNDASDICQILTSPDSGYLH